MKNFYESFELNLRDLLIRQKTCKNNMNKEDIVTLSRPTAQGKWM